MFRDVDFQFQVPQYYGRNVSGYQDRGEHGRHYDVKQIVPCIQRRDGNDQRDQYVNNSGASDLVIEGLAKALRPQPGAPGRAP